MADLSLFQKQSFGILGLARSGLATLQSLTAANCSCFFWDDGIKGQNDARSLGFELTSPEDWPWERLTAIIISPGIAHSHKVAQRAKKQNIPLWGDVELFTRAYASNPLLAITGTNGKSTSTALLAHILKTCNYPYVMGGNIGTAVLSLEPKPDDALILELSSYQLEIMPSVKPKIAALLNITPDHLDRHGNIENYAKAKEMIFLQQDHNDTAIISIDDPYCRAIFERLKAQGKQRLIPLSVISPCDDGIYVESGKLFDRSEYIADLSEAQWLKGIHNHQNIACTYIMAKNLDLPKQSIIDAIFTFKGLEHRQQYVKALQNITIINDSKATNGEAAATALAAYDNILWLMGGQKKEGGLKPCKSVLHHVQKAFAFGQDAAIMVQDLLGDNEFTIFETIDQAFNAAMEYGLARPEQQFTLLLSPAAASFDQFTSFETRGEHFLDLVHKVI